MVIPWMLKPGQAGKDQGYTKSQTLPVRLSLTCILQELKFLDGQGMFHDPDSNSTTNNKSSNRIFRSQPANTHQLWNITLVKPGGEYAIINRRTSRAITSNGGTFLVQHHREISKSNHLLISFSTFRHELWLNQFAVPQSVTGKAFNPSDAAMRWTFTITNNSTIMYVSLLPCHIHFWCTIQQA